MRMNAAPAHPAALANDPGGTPRPGARISNLRGLVAGGGGGSGLGRIGLLAVPAGVREWSRLLIVSNRHVLAAHGAAVGEVVYAPRFRRDGDRLLFDPRPQRIGAIVDEGHEGHHLFAYAGEDAADYFVDCAAALLDDAWRVGSAPEGFAGIARAHPIDALAGRGIGVRRLRIDRGVTGRLTAVDATVRTEDGCEHRNNIVIRALAGSFAGEGDSGALIVDARNRAIGLLWGVRRDDPGEAYACHIHPVLDRLGLIPCRRALAPMEAADGTG